MTIKLLDKNENIILERPFKLGYVNLIPLEKVQAELLTSWEIHDELSNCLLSHWHTFKYDCGPCNLVVSLTPKETQEVQAALREGKSNAEVKVEISCEDKATPLAKELHKLVDDLFPQIQPKQEKIIIGTKDPTGTENVSWYETKPLL